MSQEEVLLVEFKMVEQERQFQKRNVAIKVSINEIIGGKFVKEEGLNLSYILSEKGEKLSRVNIICSVVSKENVGGGQNLVIDDGTGSILVRSFEDPDIFNNVEIGDISLVIGKPREFSGECYIAVEILKKMETLGWVEVRKLELEKKTVVVEEKEASGLEEEKVDAQTTSKEVGDQKEEADLDDTIVGLIRKLDSGQGVELLEIVKNGKGTENEIKNKVDQFLKKGDIFELKPGVFKVLE